MRNLLLKLDDEDEEIPREHLIVNELLKDPEDLGLEFIDENHYHHSDFNDNLILDYDLSLCYSE